MRPKYHTIVIMFAMLVLMQTDAFSFSIKGDLDYTLVPGKIHYRDKSAGTSVIAQTTSIINLTLFTKLTGKDSKFIIGPQFKLYRNEEYTQAASIGIIIGYGDLNSHSILCGASISQNKNLRMDNSIDHQSNTFSYFGKQDDLHFNIISEGTTLGLLLLDTHPNSTLEAELALGWKKFLPFFLFGKMYDATVAPDFRAAEGYRYFCYRSGMIYGHVMYYGEQIDISLGYNAYETEYTLEEGTHNGRTFKTVDTLNSEEYRGGGITVKLKNVYRDSMQVTGEYQLLSNGERFLNIFKTGISFIL